MIPHPSKAYLPRFFSKKEKKIIIQVDFGWDLPHTLFYRQVEVKNINNLHPTCKFSGVFIYHLVLFASLSVTIGVAKVNWYC